MRLCRCQEIPFIPKLRHSVLAYADATIPISKGRYVMEASALGLLMQEAHLQPEHRVLDVACGTGYAAAVLSKLTHHVVGVESDAELAAEARNNMQQLAIPNVDIVTCNLTELPKTANEDFNVILVNGAVHDIPDGLCQVAVRGRDDYHDQACLSVSCPRSTVYRKIDGKLYHRTLCEISRPTVPLLPEFTDPKQFEF